MQRLITSGLTILLVLIFNTSTQAQLGGALKNKIKNAAKSALEEELRGNKEPVEATPEYNTATRNTNSSVKGKKLKPPAVTDHLSGAEAALKSEQFTAARYDVKEAMRGVELEIGYAILEIMPGKIDELDADLENDEVTSTGAGFVGLVISRQYISDQKQLTASIGNNSVLGATYSMLMNSSYATNEGNHKNITVQGYRGTLTFDESNTYSMGIPFGQNSVFVLECNGCVDEDELIAVSDSFVIKQFDELLKDSKNDSGVGEGVEVYLASASSSYSSKDLESTRFSLQRALEEIDILLSKKILEMLPIQLGSLTSATEADEYVASAAGFAGIYIERIYLSADTAKQIEVTLVDDSPLISMVNTFVNTPMMMGLSGNKSIKLDGYKGMYELVENSEPREITINIPSNQSLLTMRFTGLTESEVNESANQVPVGDIFKLLR